jgi:hypothetical protein
MLCQLFLFSWRKVMVNKIQALVTSRRFWVAVGGGVAFVGFDVLGVGLSQDQAQNVTIVLASWIFGDSIRSTEG